MPIGITATGGYVPPRVVDNSTMARWTGATTDWIDQRTGVYKRRYADDDVATSDLAIAAVDDLVRHHPGALDDLGAIILATSTPDQPQPATAVAVQDALGLTGVPAFDVDAVCAGWLVGVVVGAALAQTGLASPRVLVIGADKYSAIIDRTDPKTATLFGDGAAAAVLEPVPAGYGLLATNLTTDGALRQLVQVPAGGTRRPLTPERINAGEDRFHMTGRDVADYVVRTIPRVLTDALDRAGVAPSEVARYVFHQANPRLLLRLADILHLDRGTVPITGDKWGNPGAASLPLTLWDTHRRAPIQTGDVVALAAVGGGMTAGAAVFRWYNLPGTP